MSEILTNNKYYKDIADTIRQMKGVATTYKPREMAGALREMYSTEVEGVPPLTFPSNGNNLLNYRIDGANGGVGDRTKNLLQNTATSQTINGVTFTVNSDGSVTCNGTATANTIFRTVRTPDFPDNEDMLFTGCPVGGSLSTYQLQYSNNRDKAFQDMGNGIVIQKMDYNTYPNTYVQIRIVEGYTCNNLTFYPMIRLATIEDDTYEPYGYKIPVVISGKNLLQNTATSQTISGVTFTVNSDGSVTCNGTASSNAIFAISVKLNANINYILNGTPENGGVGTYRIDLRTASYSVYNNIIDNGNGANFTVEENGTYLVSIRIASNYNCNNLTFYPMIRLATIEDDTYEPYIEPTTTNIYLDEPIGANESKSLSDTNVNIPTINGTNILSIDTTVQPSNVYVQAPKTNSYNL